MRAIRSAAASTRPLRGEYGYHSNSDFLAIRVSVIAWERQYLRMLCGPPKRAPRPDCFQPECGTPKVNRLVNASLMLTEPASIAPAIRRARASLRVHTVAESPYAESLASRTASSAS